MNNLFTTGLLAISIIALNGCKESIDLTSGTYRSGTSTTAATSNTENQETNSIIVTTAPVTVIKVIDITGDVSAETTTDSGAEENTSTNESVSSSSETEQTVDTETTETSTTASCEVEASPITPFVRVQLHYGLMSGSPFVNGEVAGLDTLTVTEDAAQNATVLKLDSTIGLLPGQLITYIGSNGQNRVAKVGEVSSGQITISSGEGLETNITAGSVISNFYSDGTHPNANGYKAVADFGFRSAYPIVPAQKHVLLGDSWFDKDEGTGTSDFQNQLETRLSDSTIINAGMGGNTLCDLINRFDEDVAAETPQYVWINSSVNDYYNDVSTADYKNRMQYLIGQVQLLGATAIVFDSAPSADISFGGNNLTDLSNGYAGALYDMFEESQQ